jgi:hypothetical protein
MKDHEMAKDQVTDYLQDSCQKSHHISKWHCKTMIRSNSKINKQLSPLKHQQTIVDKYRQQQSVGKRFFFDFFILK